MTLVGYSLGALRCGLRHTLWKPGKPWAGAHSTVTVALAEWITNGTFDGAQAGRFTVDASGVARSPGT